MINNTSQIAICSDCGWRCEDYTCKGLVKSYNHAKRNRHRVSIEVAKIIIYDYRTHARRR